MEHDDPAAVRHRAARRRAARLDAASAGRMIRHFERRRAPPDGGWGMHRSRRATSSSRRSPTSRCASSACPRRSALRARRARGCTRSPAACSADPDLGQVLAGAARPLRLRGREPVPARALPAAGVAARPPEPLLLPHALHLPGHRLPLRAALPRRPRAHHRRRCGASSTRSPTSASTSPRTAHDIAATDLLRPRRRSLAAGLRRARCSTSARRSPALRRRALDHCFERILYEQRAEPLPGHLAGQRPAQLPGALCDRSRPPRARARASTAWRRWRGRTRPRASATAARARTPGTRPSPCRPCCARRRSAPARRRRPAPRPTRSCATRSSTEELPAMAARSTATRSLGGWCFSDGQHRWPVSDCTAEALSRGPRRSTRPRACCAAERAHPRRSASRRRRSSSSPPERRRRLRHLRAAPRRPLLEASTPPRCTAAA